jgi:hypothetical protein
MTETCKTGHSKAHSTVNKPVVTVKIAWSEQCVIQRLYAFFLPVSRQ